MSFNLPGTLVPLYALINPRIILPSLTVPDIRHLNFTALRDAGYRGAIFDKDNCLTLPHNDKLVPELEAAWSTALHTFGPSHVLIVSNSAGTRNDPAQLQAESVAHHLQSPVLLHAALKPSYSCASAALSALPGLAPHEIVVVGDRLFTDVVSDADPIGGQRTPLAVWTTGVWKRESMVIRWAEARLVWLIEKY
ncbi:mitochondrial PGP phosphatase-domain-containing protein, partial [Lactifluus volemus]